MLPDEKCGALQEQDADEQDQAFDYEAADFTTWSKGWREKVYHEDTTNPDITLGELLLMYFEWMSVHQVRFSPFQYITTHKKAIPVPCTGLRCGGQSSVRIAATPAASGYKRGIVGPVKGAPAESVRKSRRQNRDLP